MIEEYASWLSQLRDLDLLSVHQMKPLVNGEQLIAILGNKIRRGPWIGEALDEMMKYQLRNPHETSPVSIIQKIMSRYNS